MDLKLCRKIVTLFDEDGNGLVDFQVCFAIEKDFVLGAHAHCCFTLL